MTKTIVHAMKRSRLNDFNVAACVTDTDVRDSRNHSQASLLSKLDRPIAKACNAHMG